MSHNREVPQYGMFLLNHIMDKNQEQESPDDQNYQIKYFHELFYIEMMIIDARKFIPERRRDSKDKKTVYMLIGKRKNGILEIWNDGRMQISWHRTL